MRLNDAAGIRLKFLGVLFLLFSVASVAWLYYFKEGEIRRIVLTGMVDATQVAISSKIQGRIERLYVDEGSEVKAGENIARIDFEELKSDLARWEAEVREAEARMKEAEVRINEAQETLGMQERVVPQDILRARAMLRVSEANKDEAQANLERARKDHGRISQLVDQGILAIQERDRVEAELVAAQAAYHSAVGRVEEGKAQLEMTLANSQQLGVCKGSGTALTPMADGASETVGIVHHIHVTAEKAVPLNPRLPQRHADMTAHAAIEGLEGRSDHLPELDLEGSGLIRRQPAPDLSLDVAPVLQVVFLERRPDQDQQRPQARPEE